MLIETVIGDFSFKIKDSSGPINWSRFQGSSSAGNRWGSSSAWGIIITQLRAGGFQLFHI